MNSKFESNIAPEPVGAYPHARRRVGDLLFLSGVGLGKKIVKRFQELILTKMGK